MVNIMTLTIYEKWKIMSPFFNILSNTLALYPNIQHAFASAYRKREMWNSQTAMWDSGRHRKNRQNWVIGPPQWDPPFNNHWRLVPVGFPGFITTNALGKHLDLASWMARFSSGISRDQLLSSFR